MRYRVVAGLGNPGREYDGTRHNVGFALLDAKYGADSWQKKSGLLQKEVSVDGERLLVIKPQLYMNRSGQVLHEVCKYLGVGPDKLVVVHDEVNLPVGAIRVKTGGGDAGHNGLRSVTEVCGGDYVRVRLGVGRPPEAGREISSWVLGRFPAEERAVVEDMILRGKELLETLLKEGVENTQRIFHGDVSKSSKE